MSAFDRFERDLPQLLGELAAPRTPDYVDTVLGQTTRTRQRPGWAIPERWLPVSAVSERLATAPRAPMRAAIAVALLVVALAAGIVLIVGSQRPHVPAPFGPASNGLIAFVDDTGAIRTASPATGASTVVVPGPDNERPVYSPDGTRLAYLHRGPLGNLSIMVAAADGASPRAINVDPYTSIGYLGWSPTGTRVVAAVQSGELLSFDAASASPPTVVTDKVRGVEYSTGFNAVLAGLFRPPAGDEVLYLGSGPDQFGLYRQALAGGDPIGVLTSMHSSIPFADLGSPQWSPDGTQVAVTVQNPDNTDDWRAFVLNADGSNLRMLTHRVVPGVTISEAWPMWSPDGRQIALQRWFDGSDGAVDTRPITVVDVATGTEREVGAVNVNGYVGWGWSPDGTSIIEVPTDPSPDANRVLVVDVATGAAKKTDVTSSFAPSWQRGVP